MADPKRQIDEFLSKEQRELERKQREADNQGRLAASAPEVLRSIILPTFRDLKPSFVAVGHECEVREGEELEAESLLLGVS